MRRFIKLSVLFFILFYTTVYAAELPEHSEQPTNTESPVQQAVYILEKQISEKKDKLSITGKIPQINFVEFDKLVEHAINTKINEKYTKRLEAAEAMNATSLSVEYSTMRDGDYLSLIIKTETIAAESRSAIDIVNINISLKKIIYINDILGPNGVKISNKVIQNEIATNPDAYVADFTSITNEHDFYVENNLIILIFDKNELALNTDSHSVKININNVVNKTLPFLSYRVDRDSYNLKMIPLRFVLEAFGFELNWIPDTMTINIQRKNDFYSSMRINENLYFKNTSPKRSLEAAPILINDRTFVPISFFEEIAALFYEVHSDGAITFSEYKISS